MEDERGRIRPDLAAFNLREDPEASEVFGINIILERSLGGILLLNDSKKKLQWYSDDLFESKLSAKINIVTETWP